MCICRRTVLSELKACSSSRNLKWGKNIHQSVIRSGADSDVYVASQLVNMYAKCGIMEEARAVFDRINNPNVVPWTALIMGYADNGEAALALNLFSRMQGEGCVPNSRTFVAALKAYTNLAGNGGGRGKELHLLASRSGCDSDPYVECSLVDMYAKCGSMKDCRRVFENLSYHDVISWTALIWGYASCGDGLVALEAFLRMRCEGCDPDSRTFVVAIKACTSLALDIGKRESAKRGKALHLLTSNLGYDSNMYVQGALVDMYANIGDMEEARRIFFTMKQLDVVSWTTLILGYADNGEGEIALDLFSRMQYEACTPNSTTFVAALKACTDLAAKEEGILKAASRETGKQIHLLTLRSACGSYYVECSLVDMYAKCGSMQDARTVFENMSYHDVASWTALISGYAEQGEGMIALDLFSRMRSEGCPPEARCFVAALKVCTAKSPGGTLDKVVSRERGKILHLLASHGGHDAGMYVQSTLVVMYCQCGMIEEAQGVFESMKNPDVISWNILLLGCAENGKENLAVELFQRMGREGREPDAFTFAAILKAYGVIGALDSGKVIHDEICNRNLQNDVVLANCLVDFYAKCGSMLEAERAFASHGIKDLEILNALMAGYGRHGDIQGVFGLSERIIQPNGITFSILLTTCNHAGLVDKGRDYFEAMSTKYGLRPEVEHYACMIDMLGRSNKLDEAMHLLRRMASSANFVTWMTVLEACRKWKNIPLGRLAFQALICLDNKNAGAYVVMANLYGC